MAVEKRTATVLGDVSIGALSRLVRMGSHELQVVLDQLQVTAGQWQSRSARFTSLAPSLPGQPFQPTTAAVSGVNAAINAAATAFVARTQSTAASVAAASTGYGNQEATAAGELAAATHVTVV